MKADKNLRLMCNSKIFILQSQLLPSFYYSEVIFFLVGQTPERQPYIIKFT